MSEKHQIYGIGRKKHCVVSCIDYFCGDIGEKTIADQLKNRWKGICFDAIVHCAAVMEGENNQIYHTNYNGTENMVDFARKSDCKCFIYLSSIPVIGVPQEIPITEEHPINPQTVYHKTKYWGEIVIRDKLERVLDYKILRIASPLGAGLSERKIAGAFLRACMEEKDIMIWGSGTRIQNYIDLEDIAYAVDCAMAAKGQSGLYLIPGNSVTDQALAELCREVCHSQNKIQIERPEKKEIQWKIDGTKAWSRLGYEPRISLEETLTRILAVWKNL